MIKKWRFQESKLNKIVAMANDAVYFGNLPKKRVLNAANNITDEEIISSVFSIPFNYIKRDESIEKDGIIKIFYGKKSEDFIKLDDSLIQNEIFNLLKEKLPHLDYKNKVPSYYRSSKPSIFSFVIVLLIMLYALFLAKELEAEYIPGGGLGGIVLVIAQLGVRNVLLIFITLLILSIVVTILNIKKRSLIRMLY